VGLAPARRRQTSQSKRTSGTSPLITRTSLAKRVSFMSVSS